MKETQSDDTKNQIINDIKKIIRNQNQVKIKDDQLITSDTNKILYNYNNNPEFTNSYSLDKDKSSHDNHHFKADVDSDKDLINHGNKSENDQDEGIVNDILDKYEILLNYYDDDVINSIEEDFSENTVNSEMDRFSEVLKNENTANSEMDNFSEGFTYENYVNSEMADFSEVNKNSEMNHFSQGSQNKDYVNSEMDDFSEDFKKENTVNSENYDFSSKISVSDGGDMTSLFDSSTISDWFWQP